MNKTAGCAVAPMQQVGFSFSLNDTACSVGWWLMAGAGLF
jgi:hypothetical protein